MPEVEDFRDQIKTIDRQRLDQLSRFWQPSIPKGEEERYRLLRPLISKDFAFGNIMREDMPGYIAMNYGIQELCLYGQEDLMFTFLTSHMSEIRTTPSINALALESLTKSKLEYAQTYTVHEHQHQEPTSRGLFGRKKPSGP